MGYPCGHKITMWCSDVAQVWNLELVRAVVAIPGCALQWFAGGGVGWRRTGPLSAFSLRVVQVWSQSHGALWLWIRVVLSSGVLGAAFGIVLGVSFAGESGAHASASVQVWDVLLRLAWV